MPDYKYDGVKELLFSSHFIRIVNDFLKLLTFSIPKFIYFKVFILFYNLYKYTLVEDRLNKCIN